MLSLSLTKTFPSFFPSFPVHEWFPNNDDAGNYIVDGALASNPNNINVLLVQIKKKLRAISYRVMGCFGGFVCFCYGFGFFWCF